MVAAHDTGQPFKNGLNGGEISSSCGIAKMMKALIALVSGLVAASSCPLLQPLAVPCPWVMRSEMAIGRARQHERGIRLRGGGQAGVSDGADGDEGGRRNATAGARSWKNMVKAQMRVPFEIMGSPLLADAELERINRMRLLAAEELEKSDRQRKEERDVSKTPSGKDAAGLGYSEYAHPRAPTGAKGTYGPADAMGRRWRSLEDSGQRELPYPRVDLQYKVTKAQAESDLNLRLVDQDSANSSAQDVRVHEVQEEFEFDGTLDGFFNWYARARESPKEQAVFAQHFPPPNNLTLGPWSSQQPAGYIVEYDPVSRGYRPQSCSAADSRVQHGDRVIACGDNRWGQLGLGFSSSDVLHGAIPHVCREGKE